MALRDAWKMRIRLALMFVIIGGIYVIQHNLVINFTPSVDPTFMLRTYEVGGQINDYVTFMKQDDLIGPKAVRLTKKIACLEGDILEASGYQFFCNSKPIGVAKIAALDGRPLTTFRWNGPIPEGKVFLLGEHVDSYDSRYWGFMDKDDLERVDVIFK